MPAEDGFGACLGVRSLSEAAVAVVGLGLMGGSLAAALSESGACRQVIGIARRPSTVATALDLRFIQRGTTDLAEGVADADMVVLATPVLDILARLATIGPLLRPGCVLMDLGSTKEAICRAMGTLPPHVQPLGGHPMCGKETSGLAMSEPTLFRNKVFVLSPLARTSPEALGLGLGLVSAVGARPLVLDAARHDGLVAAISHLPYLLAVALVRAVEQVGREDALAWTLAASGFRDASRLAMGDTTMMMDILATNRTAILQSLEHVQVALGHLTRALREDDRDALFQALSAARSRRMEMYR